MLSSVNLAQFAQFSSLEKIFSYLAPYGECRLVGGCVRDILRNKIPTDFDIATTLPPKIAMELLTAKEIKVIPTGITHGTITALIPNQEYKPMHNISNNYSFQITTLRQDVETFGRKARVEYTDDWRSDAKRRDFTINAMYMSLGGELFDFLNGEADLQRGIVKFVGDPSERIEEDALRILRYFRFYAYFDGSIDTPSLNACVIKRKKLNNLSGERIRNEMEKLLLAEYAKQSLHIMAEHKVLNEIGMTEIDHHQLNKITFSNSYLVNLASIILCCMNPNGVLKAINSIWKPSNLHKQCLDFLVSNSAIITSTLKSKDMRKLHYIHGKENLELLLKLALVIGSLDKFQYDQQQNLLQKISEFKFPLKGKDLLVLGYSGVEVGKLLKTLEHIWIDSDFQKTKQDLLTRVKSLIISKSD